MEKKWERKFWTRAAVEKLITLYEKHRNLYDVSSSVYVDKPKREASFMEILDEMQKIVPGISMERLKDKIHNIRTMFLKAHKINLALKKRGVTGPAGKPKLWFYDKIRFLTKHIQIRKNKTNRKTVAVNSITRNNTKNESLVPAAEKIMDLYPTEIYTPPDQASNFSKNYEQNSLKIIDEAELLENNRNIPATSAPATSTQNIDANIEKYRDEQKLSLITSVHDTVQILKQISNDTEQSPHEFDVFCQSLAIQLKKMPLNRALICQEKLQSVMTQERLYQCAPHHTHTTYQYEMGNQNTDQITTEMRPSPVPSFIISESESQDCISYEGQNEVN